MILTKLIKKTGTFIKAIGNFNKYLKSSKMLKEDI